MHSGSLLLVVMHHSQHVCLITAPLASDIEWPHTSPPIWINLGFEWQWRSWSAKWSCHASQNVIAQSWVTYRHKEKDRRKFSLGSSILSAFSQLLLIQPTTNAKGSFNRRDNTHSSIDARKCWYSQPSITRNRLDIRKFTCTWIYFLTRVKVENCKFLRVIKGIDVIVRMYAKMTVN